MVNLITRMDGTEIICRQYGDFMIKLPRLVIRFTIFFPQKCPTNYIASTYYGDNIVFPVTVSSIVFTFELYFKSETQINNSIHEHHNIHMKEKVYFSAIHLDNLNILEHRAQHRLGKLI